MHPAGAGRLRPEIALLRPDHPPVRIGNGPAVGIRGTDELGVVRVHHGRVAMPTRVWGIRMDHPPIPPRSRENSLPVAGTPYRLYAPGYLAPGEAVLIAHFDQEDRLMDVNTPEMPLPWSALSEGASGEGCGKDVAVAAVVVLVALLAVGGGVLAWLLG